MTPVPVFPADAAEAGAALSPVSLDLDTRGHYLVFHLRVDGQSLEPNSGPCRRWLLVRVAREAGSAEQSFCSDDSVRFDVASGMRHSLDLLVGAEHTVVRRVVLRPGENVRWRIPVRTGRIEVPIDAELGHSYTVEGREEDLHLRSALLEQAPSGTRWDLEGYEPAYHSGVEVGWLRIRVLRDADGRVVEELSVPLVSGRLVCEPPFCP